MYCEYQSPGLTPLHSQIIIYMWPQWLYLKKNERPWSGTIICCVFYPSLIDATWKILYCQYEPSTGPAPLTKGTLTAQGTLLHLSCES